MLSEKPWKPESVLRLFLGVFFCILIGALLTNLLAGASEGHPVRRVLVSSLSFHAAALLLISFFLREHQLGWQAAFGFANDRLRAVRLGVLSICVFLPVCLVLQTLILKVLEHFGFKLDEQVAVQTLRLAGGWRGQTALGVMAIALAPVAEEMLFRGILYPALKRVGYPRAALWGTSLLFALVHFHVPSFLPLLVLALVLAWLYERTDNLLAPIAAHSLFNALNFVMLQLGDKIDQLPKPHP